MWSLVEVQELISSQPNSTKIKAPILMFDLFLHFIKIPKINNKNTHMLVVQITFTAQYKPMQKIVFGGQILGSLANHKQVFYCEITKNVQFLTRKIQNTCILCFFLFQFLCVFLVSAIFFFPYKKLQILHIQMLLPQQYSIGLWPQGKPQHFPPAFYQTGFVHCLGILGSLVECDKCGRE